MTTEPQGNDNGNMSDAELAELYRLARSRPKSGRGQLAKLGAIRALERLGRGRSSAPSMPEGWHPGPPGFEKLDRVYLDEHPWVRREWYARLHGEGRI